LPNRLLTPLFKHKPPFTTVSATYLRTSGLKTPMLAVLVFFLLAPGTK
jgi:hypothetical protein